MQLKNRINEIAKDRFTRIAVEEFIAKLKDILSESPVVDSILQISVDEGEELEIGFFTSEIIALSME